MSKEHSEKQIVFELIDAAESKSKLVDVLVDYTKREVDKINLKHSQSLHLQFKDYTRSRTDLYGWVLNVRQRFIDEELGFPEDDPDPIFSFVSQIEISELEINKGNPKTRILESLSNDNKILDKGPFGVSIKFTPKDYVNYLEMIYRTGNARLSEKEIEERLQ